MKHTQDEIIHALQVIQDTCMEMQGSHPCERCPLGINGKCVVQDAAPEQWKIKTTAPEWKAFK